MATTHHRPTKLSKTAHHVLAMAPHKESSLESKRRAFKPAVPSVLLGAVEMKALEPTSCVANEDQIKAKFPSLFGQQMVRLQAAGTAATTRSPLKVGCVLSMVTALDSVVVVTAPPTLPARSSYVISIDASPSDTVATTMIDAVKLSPVAAT